MFRKYYIRTDRTGDDDDNDDEVKDEVRQK